MAADGLSLPIVNSCGVELVPRAPLASLPQPRAAVLLAVRTGSHQDAGHDPCSNFSHLRADLAWLQRCAARAPRYVGAVGTVSCGIAYAFGCSKY